MGEIALGQVERPCRESLPNIGRDNTLTTLPHNPPYILSTPQVPSEIYAVPKQGSILSIKYSIR